MFKKILKYILAFSLIIATFSCTQVSAYQISGFELTSETAMLISLDTGDVLYQKNESVTRYPASLTKLLVATIVLDNTADLDTEKIVMTQDALNQIIGTGSSVIGLMVGEELTVRQALYCLLVSSGGDVAYAIAEHFGNDTAGFVNMMNEQAKKIGMKNSHFGNPVGLHDDATYTTAQDIAVLAKYVLNYQLIKDITSTVTYTLPATNKSKLRNIRTTNFLIDPNTNYYYTYATGMKTGFTDEAGRCLVSTASYGGYNYLCILMACHNKNGRRNEFTDARNLFRWAFNYFEYKSVLDITKPVAELPVDLAMSTDYIKLYPKHNITKIMPKVADSSTVEIVTHLNTDVAEAPIKPETPFGTADIVYAGETIGTVELISKDTVKASAVLVIIKAFKDFFKSTAFKIIIAVIGAALIIYIALIIKLNSKKKSHRKVKYMPYNKHDENK